MNCDTSKWEVTWGIGVHSKLKTSLGYMRPNLKSKEEKGEGKGRKGSL